MNQLYYIGYDAIHPKEFIYDVPEGFGSYLLVITTTPALFRVNETVSEYPAHSAILYPPGCPIWYSAAEKPYGNHWLRFTSNESFVKSFPQLASPFLVSDPEYCRNLFQLLTWEASQMLSSTLPYQNTGIITEQRDAGQKHRNSDSFQTDFVISQLLRILFGKLHDDLLNTPASFHDYELLSLRRRISTAPQLPWNISDIARELHISTGHLQLLYKQKFHISCMDDVIHFRLLKARDLLVCTTQSITEIAEQCGYNNTEHFCRQFRKHLGISPGQYRKEELTTSQKGEQG